MANYDEQELDETALPEQSTRGAPSMQEMDSPGGGGAVIPVPVGDLGEL